jgi:hypothetical protein
VQAKDLRKGDLVAEVADDIRKVKSVRVVGEKVDIVFENTDPSNAVVATYRVPATKEIEIQNQ